jgi:hypothetical protein
MHVFLICNQHRLFFGKQQHWLNESDSAKLFQTPHYDVALNQLIEVNARDIEQRLTLWQCPLDDKGQLMFANIFIAEKKAQMSFDEPEPPTETGDEEPAGIAVSDDGEAAEMGYAGGHFMATEKSE